MAECAGIQFLQKRSWNQSSAHHGRSTDCHFTSDWPVMTWLFIRVYAGVLAVLFMAWYIHGTVLQHRSDTDLARVILEAHAGGARLVANQLAAAKPSDRDKVLANIRKQFAYPVELRPTGEAPDSIRELFSGGQDVAYHRDDDSHFVVASISQPTRPEMSDQPTQCVWLGPFPSYRRIEIENSIAGWMLLAAHQIDESNPAQRPAAIDRLQHRFEIAIQLAAVEELPEAVRRRIGRGDQVVFYEDEPAGSDRFYSVTPMAGGSQMLRFGPFPSFQRIEQKAATTTLALVLLPAAFAIALLLRPVARQLRHVENAAKAIASGDLNARVNESRVHAVKPLAHSFNFMAERTESLVKSHRELLQAVSHELRTPLARIRFAADLIGTAKTDQERQRRLAAVDEATQQLDDLVGELLTYVRADSGDVKVAPENVSVAELFSEVIKANEPLHPSLDFQLAGDCDDLVVVADRAGLMRALNNLTRNAARFAKHRVVLSAQKIDHGISICVDDDGPGVSEADREKIFQPFIRLEGTSDSGSGLGLALVDRIIRSHGGDVRVDDSPGGGARFEITLSADSGSSLSPQLQIAGASA